MRNHHELGGALPQIVAAAVATIPMLIITVRSIATSVRINEESK